MVPTELRRQFWLGVKAGVSVEEAADAASVCRGTARHWLRQSGGMIPPHVLVEPSGFRLSLAERELIMVLRSAGASIRAVARELRRAPSTISRELDRNSNPFRGYRASVAQSATQHRAKRPKVGRLAQNETLNRHVQVWLDDGFSPEQIGHRLRVDFPDDPEMWVSTETIYQSLYVQGRGNLRRDLHKQLRTGRAIRKPRRRDGERRNRIPNMINISERPPEVADRAVPGHWEGDLIVGTESKSAIGTLVERTTRFVMLLHLPDNHTALAVQEAMVAAMAKLPATLRKTLTWDQGMEMRNHAEIAAATDMDIYFCDPHSPWQRGSNENTNGLLRQYFPKGQDLSIFTADYLDFIAARLNRRPRKTLDWRTPAEALDELLSNPSKPHGVAITA